MRLFILDFRERLRCLSNGNERVKSDKQQNRTPEQILELAAAQDEPFVILWHKPAEEAVKLMGELAPHWPSSLCGCIFFSSEPFANAGADLEALRARIPTQQSRRVHLLSSGVSYTFDPDGDESDRVLWSRLQRFRNHVLARSGLAPVDFTLLEPEMVKAAEFGEQLRSRISHLAASDRRKVRTGTLPVLIDCPACRKRGWLHHELKKLGDELQPTELQELLVKDQVQHLKELLKHGQMLKSQVVEDLCKNIDVRLASSPQWKKIERHVDRVFHNCKLLNHDLAQQAELALDSCLEALKKPDQWELAKTLAKDLRGSLDCEQCNKDHKVLL